MPVAAFPHKLVLNRFMLSLFGADVLAADNDPFREVTRRMTDETLEGRRADGSHLLLDEVARLVTSESGLTREMLVEYDANIGAHTDRINHPRTPPLEWKYFQYLALLFTEIYLDRYFSAPEKLLDDLNSHLTAFNASLRDRGEETRHLLTPFAADDLRKLSFWNATGSGKTLLLHVNVLQFRRYLKKAGREKEFNRVLVLTPNEGLTRQHLEEFRASGIAAEAFDKEKSGSGFLAGQVIDVIDMNKLKEEGKKKTVSVDQFETNNLVLIDEGHRGAKGDVWSEMRARLASDGFTFEYSATLGQAAAGDKDLADSYAKNILFDYSYRYFHADGFGKDYSILNIDDAGAAEADLSGRHLYLCACLLAFYQQLRLFDDRRSDFGTFDIHKPLLVFVGSRVTAVRKEGGRQVSDVVDVLLFLSQVANERARTIAEFDKLLRGEAGILNDNDEDVFANAFPYLVGLDEAPEMIFDDMLRRLFNAPAPGVLHIEYLVGGDRELALRVGDGDEPFGVVNVGDAKAVADLCETHGDFLKVSRREFSDSLFAGLNRDDSKLNVLIGSKRFTEGWNSYRVSTMGLLHMGRTEGSEIIQLFGRGVRLRGFGASLKRSRAILWASKGGELAWVPKDAELPILETLNVFGVRSDYMVRFNDFLDGEGITRSDDRVVVDIPVKTALPATPLITVRIPEGVDFMTGAKAALETPPTGFLPKRLVTLDWYPRVLARASRERDRVLGDGRLHEGKLGPGHVAFIDLDAVYLELLRFKKQKRWRNFILSKAAVEALLHDDGWYTLYIPPERLEFRGFEQVREWEEIAVALLKKYCDRYYKYRRDQFETPHRIYRELAPDDPNFFDAYRVLIDRSETKIIEKIEELRERIGKGELADFNLAGVGRAIFPDMHLYVPLVYLGKGLAGDVLQIFPVHLNEGEYDFVNDLCAYLKTLGDSFKGKEVYLLRNRSRGHGVGFFEAGNFYPDFILWIVDGDSQHVVFVDPKGILWCEGIDDPKLRFFETVKEIEARMRADGMPMADRVSLHSFVVSNTPLANVRWWKEELATSADFAKRNVLFQIEDKGTYIETIFYRVLGAPAP